MPYLLHRLRNNTSDKLRNKGINVLKTMFEAADMILNTWNKQLSLSFKMEFEIGQLHLFLYLFPLSE